MRLTLRTLLAYLDDVLQPEMLKELGDKIRESPMATGLVGRIREVMRRRRLGAPDLEGPGMGLEPNTVSEYLNDVLPPEGVEDVERVCLASDVHLAEVAACHQIVAHHFVKPMDVVPSIRDHMYALGPTGTDSSSGSGVRQTIATPGQAPPVKPKSSISIPTLASLTKPKSSVNIPVMPADPSGIVPADSKATFQESLPEALRNPPWTKRVLPALVVVVGAAIWIGLFWNDPNLWRRPKNDSNANTKPNPAAGQLAQNDAGKPLTETAAGSKPVPPEGTGDPVAVMPKPQPANAGDPPPPADELETKIAASAPNGSVSLKPATVTVPATTSVVPAPSGPVVAATTPLPVPMVTTELSPKPLPPATTTTLPVAVNEPAKILPFGNNWTAQYTSADGMLLRFNGDDRHWYVQPRRSEVRAGDRLACPEPFESILEIGPGAAKMTVLGQTLIEFQGKTDEAPLTIRLQRGRFVLQADKREDQLPVRLAVKIGTEIWHVELPATDSQCAFEVRQPEPFHFDQSLHALSVEGTLYASGGMIRVREPGGNPPKAMAKGQWLGLSAPLLPENAAQPKVTPTAVAASDAPHPWPTWLDPQQRRATSALRRYVASFERLFELNQPMDVTMSAGIRDPQPKLAELSVLLLGLTGNRSELVLALAQSDYEESRAAAAAGLRSWLVSEQRTPNDLAQLQADLQKFFKPEDAETVYRLLWGYGPADAKSKVTSLQLIEWMKSSHVAIRELSFKQVVKLTGKKYDYRPLGTQSQRDSGVRKWYEHLDKDGALLKPE